MKHKLTRLKKTGKAPDEYDLVVVGSPVWAGNPTPAVRTYLSENHDKIKRAAFFCCKGGLPAKQFFPEMAKVCGQRPLAVMEIKRGEGPTGVAAHKMLRFAGEIQKGGI
ncbi:MAG: hypothetical protein JW873_06015 [Candidatus Saganbacteria bacterium]|nr:hypothetical protein [Candidatus Saganbacteria bacterium]